MHQSCGQAGCAPAVTARTCPSPAVPVVSQEVGSRANLPISELSSTAWLCQAASRDILTARVSQAAASPHAHLWSHHPVFLGLLASLMFGGSQSTPGLAALRDWHWFCATVVCLGPRWTQSLMVVLWVGWGCPHMGQVLVLDMKWLSETSALNTKDETNLSSSFWAEFWLVRLAVRVRAINAIKPPLPVGITALIWDRPAGSLLQDAFPNPALPQLGCSLACDKPSFLSVSCPFGARLGGAGTPEDLWHISPAKLPSRAQPLPAPGFWVAVKALGERQLCCKCLFPGTRGSLTFGDKRITASHRLNSAAARRPHMAG